MDACNCGLSTGTVSMVQICVEFYIRLVQNCNSAVIK